MRQQGKQLLLLVFVKSTKEVLNVQRGSPNTAHIIVYGQALCIMTWEPAAERASPIAPHGQICGFSTENPHI